MLAIYLEIRKGERERTNKTDGNKQQEREGLVSSSKKRDFANCLLARYSYVRLLLFSNR